MNHIHSIENSQRTQLQSNEVNSWLRKRHFNKVKKQYLLFPEQIKQEQEIRKIFQNFDKDNSNNLDISEMYEMFQKFGFQVTEKQLKNFFKVVDKDKDNALNWDEFKNSVFDEDASKIFYNIIKEIRKQDSQNQCNNNYGYIPFQFNDMISYLNFLTSRNELQDQIKLDSLSTFEKFQKYLGILKLNQDMKQNYNCEMKSIQEEKKDETVLEHEFTKDHSNKFNHSKSSFYNKNDLPILMKLKTQKKQRQEINPKSNLDMQQTFLSNQQSWLSQKRQDKHLNSLQHNHLIMLNNSSPSKTQIVNRSQGSNSKGSPYLSLNINNINCNYRDNNQNQDFKEEIEQSRIDRLPSQLFQELQSFKRLSGYQKQKELINLKTSPNRLSQYNQKSMTSLLKTSAEINPNSPSLSKLCTPRQYREEKMFTQRRIINRPILQTYSQYSQLEKPINFGIKGKSLQNK